jgi:hypothetical protein
VGWRRRGTAVLVLAAPLYGAAALGVPALALAGSPSCQPSWGSVPSFGWNGFVSVDAVTPTDAWAVGKSSGTSPVAHFDGTRWNLMPVPLRRHRTTVEARAANDVWTVAKDSVTGPNSIEHYDGTSWSTVLMPRAVEVNDLAALSPADVWAVGSISDGNQGTRSPFVGHWDGSRWETVPNVTRGALDTTYAALQSVVAVAPDDVWAVGIRAASEPARPGRGDNRTVIEHWDGTSWTLVPSPQADAVSVPYSLSGINAVAADDLWAVGYANPGAGASVPLVEHWDGASWTIVPTPVSAPGARLHAVAASSAGDVWAVGEQPLSASGVGGSGVETLIEHWDGTSWSVVGPTFGERRLVALTALPDGTVFAAGGALYELCAVRVLDGGVSPAVSAGVPLGVPVAWSFASDNALSHSVGDALGLGLFDSGPRAPGSSFTYAFPVAGAFPVLDEAGRPSTIKVSMSSGGRTITEAMVAQYTIRWGIGPPPDGGVYDVQLKPLLGRYTDFLLGTTVPGMTFTPAALDCPCQVRARLRHAATGAASGWSTAIRIDP